MLGLGAGRDQQIDLVVAQAASIGHPPRADPFDADGLAELIAVAGGSDPADVGWGGRFVVCQTGEVLNAVGGDERHAALSGRGCRASADEQ